MSFVLTKQLSSWRQAALALTAVALIVICYSVVTLMAGLPASTRELPLDPRIVFNLNYTALLFSGLSLLVIAVGLWFAQLWARMVLWFLAITTSGAAFMAHFRLEDYSGWGWWLALLTPLLFWSLLLLVRGKAGVATHTWLAVPLMAIVLQVIVFWYSPFWFSDVRQVIGAEQLDIQMSAGDSATNAWSLLAEETIINPTTEQYLDDLLWYFGYNYESLELIRSATDPEMRAFLVDTQQLVEQFLDVVATADVYQCSVALTPEADASCVYALPSLLPNLVLTHAVAQLSTDSTEATSYTLAVLEYADLVLTSRDYDLSSYPHALRLYDTTLDIIERLLASPELEGDTREQLLRNLADNRPDGTAYQHLVSAIYLSDIELMRQIDQLYHPSGLAARYLWQPNRTKQFLADAANLQISYVKNGCDLNDHTSIYDYLVSVWNHDTWYDLAPNTIGILLVNDHLGEATEFGDRECAVIERIDRLLEEYQDSSG